MAAPSTAPAQRHLDSRPASVRSQATTPTQAGSTTADREKHFTHDTINQVTKHEQNQCVPSHPLVQ